MFQIGDQVVVVTKSGKRVLRFDAVEFANEHVVRLKDGSTFTPSGASIFAKGGRIELESARLNGPGSEADDCKLF